LCIAECYTGSRILARVSLPYLTAELPGIGGVLRAHVEDFVVDEQPAYAPSGSGTHVFVRIEKRGLTTQHAIEALAGALGVPARDVGAAGMKDRHAVTTQWLSLPPPATPEAALAVTVDGIRVLEATRHEHKLRTGHLRGNAFRLRVRDAEPGAAERASEILARLAEAPGAPNWYAEQRFGKFGDNAARGRALVLGETKLGRDRKLNRLLVSALQSELFNAWLVARLADGMYRRTLSGDLLHKTTGGMFECTDPATDTARLVAGELVPTGPMFGDRMRQPSDQTEAAAREDAILAAANLARDAFVTVRQIAEGTRRDAAIAVADVAVVEEAPGTIQVAFRLPAGAYATAVMREVMKAPDALRSGA
jgi:tRNA pseudouridine13 synthase